MKFIVAEKMESKMFFFNFTFQNTLFTTYYQNWLNNCKIAFHIKSTKKQTKSKSDMQIGN